MAIAVGLWVFELFGIERLPGCNNGVEHVMRRYSMAKGMTLLETQWQMENINEEMIPVLVMKRFLSLYLCGFNAVPVGMLYMIQKDEIIP